MNHSIKAHLPSSPTAPPPADVKGANLLVETTGRVKLADFGMAKQMVEEASFTKSFKGSAFWMVRGRGRWG